MAWRSLGLIPDVETLEPMLGARDLFRAFLLFRRTNYRFFLFAFFFEKIAFQFSL